MQDVKGKEVSPGRLPKNEDTLAQKEIDWMGIYLFGTKGFRIRLEMGPDPT